MTRQRMGASDFTSRCDEYDDELIRYEIDGDFDEHTRRRLQLWKKILQRRFNQRSIYIKISGSAVFL